MCEEIAWACISEIFSDANHAVTIGRKDRP